jgi:hypothetical protein
MVMTITIDAFGETELNRTLLRITKAAEDMRPAFNAIHDNFLILEQRQFESEGGYSGGWAPLAESTVRAKAAAGLDPHILRATDELFKSLTEKDDENHIFTVTGDTMFIGSKVDYGKYHQSREPRSRLPRRPPVVLPEATKKIWVKFLQSWLMEAQVNSRG